MIKIPPKAGPKRVKQPILTLCCPWIHCLELTLAEEACGIPVLVGLQLLLAQHSYRPESIDGKPYFSRFTTLLNRFTALPRTADTIFWFRETMTGLLFFFRPKWKVTMGKLCVRFMKLLITSSQHICCIVYCKWRSNCLKRMQRWNNAAGGISYISGRERIQAGVIPPELGV